MNLTENEKKIIEILNLKNNKEDIWTSAQDLVNRANMSLEDLEMVLYLLQMKGLIRVSMDEHQNVKMTTEEKVQTTLSNRISSAFGGMEEAREEAVEDEEYEEAAKLRDWILMSKDPKKQDELVNSILEDIDNDIE